jgi:hypothetical protein
MVLFFSLAGELKLHKRTNVRHVFLAETNCWYKPHSVYTVDPFPLQSGVLWCHLLASNVAA